MQNKKSGVDRTTVFIRVIACFLILGFGIAGFALLKKLKKEPVQSEVVEHALKVETEQVQFTDEPVLIEAYGQLRSIRMVDIAAEVAGTIVQLHPNLQTGEIIRKGELLFAIDELDYRTEYESNATRLGIVRRDKEIAVGELKRVRTLFEKNNVGTEAGVEKAEQTANSIADKLAQIKQAMTRAQINVERCKVVAPFTCRITSKQIELGQYVAPGKIVLGLADDSILELEVPLDSGDAFNWLTFDGQNSQAGAWFAEPKPVQCNVIWTENKNNRAIATLDRVSLFDEQTRTVRVVLRMDSKQFDTQNRSIPLVSGMFCKVQIPGKNMEKVVALPRWAVSFENTVYLVKNKRLVTVPVEVARVQDNKAFVSSGLASGDLVVITRLVNPLEQSLAQIVQEDSHE